MKQSPQLTLFGLFCSYYDIRRFNHSDRLFSLFKLEMLASNEDIALMYKFCDRASPELSDRWRDRIDRISGKRFDFPT